MPTTTKTADDIDLDIDLDDDDDDTTEAQTALQLRHPGLPVSLAALAMLRGEALEVLETRVLLLETAWKRALRLTAPRDWTLNRAPNGATTCYLEDAGCHRVRGVIGIEITRVSKPEKIVAADGSSFTYVVEGDGRSTFTRQRVVNVEGGRCSDEDFFTRQKLSSAVLELKVRKAARANLNGTICRELAGLKNVALEDLLAAWQGTTKNVDLCNKGHGFGSGSERLGGSSTREGEPDVPAPTCPHCAPVNGAPVKLRYRAAKDNRKAFYGCPNYDKHPQQKIIVDAEQWIAKQGGSDTVAPTAAS